MSRVQRPDPYRGFLFKIVAESERSLKLRIGYSVAYWLDEGISVIIWSTNTQLDSDIDMTAPRATLMIMC